MSSKWIETTLGDVASLQRGHDLPMQSRKKGDVPIMGSFGITGYHNEARVKGPGVVIGRSGGSMGVVSYIVCDYWPLNTVLFVTDFHGNDERFVYYLLKTLNFQAFNTGSAQASLNRNYVHPIKVTIPKDVDEQRRIAKILSDLENKIELNRQINQNLQQIVQAIFKSWFVDFEPVKAKILAKEEGRDSERAAMCAISGKSDEALDRLTLENRLQLAAAAALFPDEMEESEIGPIPSGWQYQPLGEICRFMAGSAFKPKLQGQSSGDYPFIKVSDMNIAGNEMFICSAQNYVTEAQRKEMNAKLHPKGATVFAKIGVALTTNRRRLLIEPTIIDNNMMSVTPIEAETLVPFLYLLLMTLDFNTIVGGTALPYLNVSDLQKIMILMPSADSRYKIFRAFNKTVQPCFDFIKWNADQSCTLSELHDAMLPKLLSGEIEVNIDMKKVS